MFPHCIIHAFWTAPEADVDILSNVPWRSPGLAPPPPKPTDLVCSEACVFRILGSLPRYDRDLSSSASSEARWPSESSSDSGAPRAYISADDAAVESAAADFARCVGSEASASDPVDL